MERSEAMKRSTWLGFLGLALWATSRLSWGAAARAGDWPGWRGPTGCGTVDVKDLPLK